MHALPKLKVAKALNPTNPVHLTSASDASNTVSTAKHMIASRGHNPASNSSDSHMCTIVTGDLFLDKTTPLTSWDPTHGTGGFRDLKANAEYTLANSQVWCYLEAF